MLSQAILNKYLGNFLSRNLYIYQEYHNSLKRSHLYADNHDNGE